MWNKLGHVTVGWRLRYRNPIYVCVCVERYMYLSHLALRLDHSPKNFRYFQSNLDYDYGSSPHKNTATMVAVLTKKYCDLVAILKKTATMVAMRLGFVAEIQPRRRQLRESLSWRLRSMFRNFGRNFDLRRGRYAIGNQFRISKLGICRRHFGRYPNVGRFNVGRHHFFLGLLFDTRPDPTLINP